MRRLAPVAGLAAGRAGNVGLRDAVKLVPDALGLVRRLATDRTIPRSARWPVLLLVGYLAVPIDVIPDFIPVVGYVDDLMLVSVVLRRLVQQAGPDKIAEHWAGSPEGLAALRTALRLP